MRQSVIYGQVKSRQTLITSRFNVKAYIRDRSFVSELGGKWWIYFQWLLTSVLLPCRCCWIWWWCQRRRPVFSSSRLSKQNLLMKLQICLSHLHSAFGHSMEIFTSQEPPFVCAVASLQLVMISLKIRDITESSVPLPPWTTFCLRNIERTLLISNVCQILYC